MQEQEAAEQQTERPIKPAADSRAEEETQDQDAAAQPQPGRSVCLAFSSAAALLLVHFLGNA